MRSESRKTELWDVEIVEKQTKQIVPATDVKAVKQQGAVKAYKQQRAVKSLGMKALAPQLSFSKQQKENEAFLEKAKADSIDEDTYSSSPLKDDAAKAWGSGAGTFERIQDYLLYKKVYENVDSLLFFPSLFHRHKIQGATSARIVINDMGNCDWQQTQIQGTDAYIQIYVLSVLRKACTQNYKRFLKKRLLTNVDLSFQFELTEHLSQEMADKNRYIVGNTLMFYRNSARSIMEWEFGPFQGIFPVPAVYLNIGWIKENWDRLVHSKDPFQEFRKEFGESPGNKIGG